MLIPTGMRGQRPESRCRRSRSETTSAPSLLKPRRLIKADCSGKRKIRGFGFPGCGFAVTVPISTKPNPSAAHARSATPFLSKPAASPTGLGNEIPKTVVGLGGGWNALNPREISGTAQNLQRKMMRGFGIEREKPRPNESFVGAGSLHLPMQN